VWELQGSPAQRHQAMTLVAPRIDAISSSLQSLKNPPITSTTSATDSAR
jgi:hypothetical protein